MTLTASSDWPLARMSSFTSANDSWSKSITNDDTFSLTSATLEGDIDDSLSIAGLSDPEAVSKAMKGVTPVRRDDETSTTWTVVRGSKPSASFSDLLKRLHLSKLNCRSSAAFDDELTMLENRLARGSAGDAAIQVHVAQVVDVNSPHPNQPRGRNAYA